MSAFKTLDHVDVKGERVLVRVDLNVPLNLLWVSVEPRPGVILELFGAMQAQLPEARLVGHRRD